MNFTIGIRVKILPYAEYRNRYDGECGVVENCNPFGNHDKIGVRLDNHTNSASGYGIFWFSKDNVKILNDEENEFMLSNFKVAGIRFLEGSNTETIYHYALYDDNIVPGDIVVVQSGHHGLGIAKVDTITYDIEAKSKVQCGREIVAKVDFSDYENRKALEMKAKDLKKLMDAKVKELQNTAIYEMLAEKDPELKSMLEEYKTLIK